MKRHEAFDEQLATQVLFEGLPNRTMREVERLFTPVDLAPGTVITREGRAPSQLVLVVDGTVAISAGERLVTTRGPGDHLGEISLLANRPQTATAFALDHVHGYVASRREFAELLTLAPQVEQRFWASTARRLAELRTVDASSQVA